MFSTESLLERSSSVLVSGHGTLSWNRMFHWRHPGIEGQHPSPPSQICLRASPLESFEASSMLSSPRTSVGYSERKGGLGLLEHPVWEFWGKTTSGRLQLTTYTPPPGGVAPVTDVWHSAKTHFSFTVSCAIEGTKKSSNLDRPASHHSTQSSPPLFF